ncbi:NeuD/PglB/VioB family sugar acetyltransferase [Vibrio alginolyticus]|uniref:NeuD/PglB/VioB family sugar acetyltransferase n=1 Tax=Vibrio alginolyticus TaxID=663 RepID=UPI001BD234E3|nr:NeuD/PglB/VioB family sugar acetyltransferase [Vibrio alginolyticus]EME9802044.1 NeuD/PglB/VioB family sugar acetyltransferase [Vibrio alginolyticus]MBS9837491.1 NeuD/PglB/VioB family sugar acetyltransferase [Vibrio alginolyticus]
MMTNLILIGGGGHCAACIDVIESQGKYRIQGILDRNNKVGTTLSGYPVLATDAAISEYVDQGCHFLITVGQIQSSSVRESLYEQLLKLNAKLATVISPRAHVSRTAQIGKGVIVMHDALINAGAQVLDNCIINTKSLIEHDALIAAHCHISTGAIVNGGAEIAAGSFVGSNAVVVQGVKTESKAFIKAGSCYLRPHQPLVPFKTAVLTTIFSINEEYIHDYFKSLERQTVQGFDVILVNDGFGHLNAFKSLYSNLNIIELESSGNIAKNREVMCQFALHNQYDVAVFADIDDYFSENRIAHSLELLREHDIVVNDLTSFSENKELAVRILSSRIADRDEISLEFIRDKNLFGLSNTAIRLQGLDADTLRFPSSLIAVDWFLFTQLLYQSKRAVFTNQAITFYRQHQENTVGVGDVTKESLQQSLKVREIHYKHMLTISDTFQAELDSNHSLIAQLNQVDECEKILKMNQKNNESPLFWWEVITK